jgi:hypothetical protein
MNNTLLFLLISCLVLGPLERGIAQVKKASPVSSDTANVHKQKPKKPQPKPKTTKEHEVSKRDSINIEVYMPLLRQKDSTSKW